jgi:hypothetical protein
MQRRLVSDLAKKQCKRKELTLWLRFETSLKLRPGPSQAVIYVVREAVEGAHRSLFLRRVTGGAVVLSLQRDHHLHVTDAQRNPVN